MLPKTAHGVFFCLRTFPPSSPAPPLGCMVLAGSDRSQPITSLTYFRAGSPASTPRTQHPFSPAFQGQDFSMQKLAFAWHKARDHQLSCWLNFQGSLSLAEENVWVGLLFRKDNKCSGLEPKLAPWSILQVLQKQVCRCHGEPGPDQVPTVKDSGCPSG